jgi:orotate phosphoribosyltransferase
MIALKGRLKEMVHEMDCIKYGTFPLASGGNSYYKIDCGKLSINKESRNILGKMGSDMLLDIEKGKTYEIIGVMSGGYKFGKIVAERLGRNVVGVDPHNGKVYGKISRPHACLFEDVVTKGGSVLKCQKIIGDYPSAKHAICIADREEGGKFNLRKKGIELKSILTIKEMGVARH